MSAFVFAAVVSSLICLGLLATFSWHGRFTCDHTGGGPQKQHALPVPRVGGVAIVAGVLAAAVWVDAALRPLLLTFLLAASPAFACGLLEDLTKRISPAWRLCFTALAALAAFMLLDARVLPPGFAPLDDWLAPAAVACAVTVLAVAGISNAMNIIDGVNGLSSVCVLMMLGCIGFVAWQVGDSALCALAFAIAGAVIGFVIWNYPQGLIFLGDGGAYFSGFAVAVLALMLAVRNPAVSPILVFVLCAYPIFETLFSIWRRLQRRGRSPFAPDALHLHSLVHRRLVRCPAFVGAERRRVARNAMTAPYLWCLCLMSVLPCALWWDDSARLAGAAACMATAYLVLYRAILRLRTPLWLRTQPRVQAN